AAVRWCAVEALGRLGLPEAVPDLAALVSGGERSLRLKAVDALGVLGPAALPEIRTALRNEDNGVQWCAAEALGRLGLPETAPDLAALAKGADRSLRLKAVEALGLLGPGGLEALQEALRDPDGEIRAEAVRAIARTPGSRSVDLLCDALLRYGEEVRRAAAEALGGFSDARVVPALLAALRDPSLQVRRAAAESLGRREELGEVAPRLGEALRDDDMAVRIRIAAVLTGVGAPAAPVFAQALLDGDADLRWRAGQALVQIGEPAVPILCALLNSEEAEYRERAAEVLAPLALLHPCAALRGAIPALRRRLLPWSMEGEPARQSYQAALQAIRQATAGLKDLPLPAAAPAVAPGDLPIPGGRQDGRKGEEE
ncbi:MAG TPA: HEAT repeat domain-containing protein, partial [Armatimonadota bacterium]|nr:HEAT repeat domain-containing protein [Armatimonadota bacterium]